MHLARRRRPAAFRLASSAALLLGVTTCHRDNVRFLLEPIVSSRANHNSPVPVAVVAVRDQKLLEKVLEMNAQQWFARRDQLRRDYPGGDAFEEWEWEFVPGQTPPMAVIEVDGRALAAVIFANYRTPGDHRVRIGTQRRLRVDLGQDDISVRPIVMKEGRQ
jgi:type VI secretion system protein